MAYNRRQFDFMLNIFVHNICATLFSPTPHFLFHLLRSLRIFIAIPFHSLTCSFLSNFSLVSSVFPCAFAKQTKDISIEKTSNDNITHKLIFPTFFCACVCVLVVNSYCECRTKSHCWKTQKWKHETHVQNVCMANILLIFHSTAWDHREKKHHCDDNGRHTPLVYTHG